MASQLKVDTLTGVTTAGSIDVTGEGNSTTTSLQQGLAKAFVNFNGESTIASRDSFNVGSLTDVATGTYNITFTNNLGNGNYTTSCAGGDTNAAGVMVCQPHDSLAPTTSVCRVTSLQAHASQTDEPYIGAVIHGDLA